MYREDVSAKSAELNKLITFREDIPKRVQRYIYTINEGVKAASVIKVLNELNALQDRINKRTAMRKFVNTVRFQFRTAKRAIGSKFGGISKSSTPKRKNNNSNIPRANNFQVINAGSGTGTTGKMQYGVAYPPSQYPTAGQGGHTTTSPANYWDIQQPQSQRETDKSRTTDLDKPALNNEKFKTHLKHLNTYMADYHITNTSFVIRFFDTKYTIKFDNKNNDIMLFDLNAKNRSDHINGVSNIATHIAELKKAAGYAELSKTIDKLVYALKNNNYDNIKKYAAEIAIIYISITYGTTVNTQSNWSDNPFGAQDNYLYEYLTLTSQPIPDSGTQ